MVVIALAPCAETIDRGGGGVVGGHAVHVFVEVIADVVGAVSILGPGSVKHADGEDLGAGRLQRVGPVDGVVGNVVVKTIAMGGVAVGEHDHDLAVARSGLFQSLCGHFHAVV